MNKHLNWTPRPGDIVRFDKLSPVKLVVDVHHPFGPNPGLAWVTLMGPSGIVGPMSIQGFQKVSMKVLND